MVELKTLVPENKSVKSGRRLDPLDEKHRLGETRLGSDEEESSAGSGERRLKRRDYHSVAAIQLAHRLVVLWPALGPPLVFFALIPHLLRPSFHFSHTDKNLSNRKGNAVSECRKTEYNKWKPDTKGNVRSDTHLEEPAFLKECSRQNIFFLSAQKNEEPRRRGIARVFRSSSFPQRTADNSSYLRMTISPQPQHSSSHHWMAESSTSTHRTLTPSYQQTRSESRTSNMPDPVERHVARWRSESRNSNRDKVFRNDEEFSQQDEIVNGTLSALKDDVEQTTEIIRRKQEQMRIERRQFQTEMEVNGRIDIDPADDWLTARLKAVSSDDMNHQLGKLKEDQRQNAVTDTLAALVYDVNATTEVLRRASQNRGRGDGRKKHREEIEYTLRLTPAPEDFPPPRPKHADEESFTVDDVSRDYGVEMSQQESESLRRRRARSTTPRRTLHISGSPPLPPAAVCAYCSEEIDGPILTALAPNSTRAQKFHTYHFMCTYCQKALNMHGTFREHDRKPYCHDCFYKLYNGLQYQPDEHQAVIEKLI
ncbi:unnamed protein product [Caenorhabditis auriculariae]|uniref:LIM zinc-binding domain-containing protein n=1 Tax=Caenorhabditis auriculariae TaxID=2777116 RepID=A0A8S1GPT9_9PELO|nr:unnamed protein product [Caenorhabditis auriculariae]